MVIFEIYRSIGEFEKANSYLDFLKSINDTSNLPEVKFMELIREILLNLEVKNNDFIINRCLSFRRRYSKFLKFNPGGKLLISYFIRLCNASNAKKGISYTMI